MRILKFVGKNLHGYLNLSPEFYPDLTFLTGINGSGKTSVVRGISSLLSPSLVTLAYTIHERMELVIYHNNEEITIWSEMNGDQLILGASKSDEALKINVFPEGEFNRPDQSTTILQYYEEQEARNHDHQVLRLIHSLPTPMILGIDRRSRELIQTERVFTRPPRMRRRRENIFRTSLTASLEEAIDLSERHFRVAELQRLELTEKLREKIILNALKYEGASNIFTKENLPQWYDSIRLEERKATAAKTLADLGLPQEDVSRQLDSFLNKLKELMDTIPTNLDTEKIDFKKNPKVANALVEWTINRPQFERIVSILDLADQYVKEAQTVRMQIQGYLDAVNSFLHDANKEIQFNERGDLCVTVKQKSLEPLTSLSSGESQLVVILAHLSFNPVAKTANVFIVDEPELSLHLKWQEAFVSAIQKANPDLQLILATHSPSIVLDRTKYCIDLSETTK
jgi:predicted ATP-binding protein involved in virulence